MPKRQSDNISKPDSKYFRGIKLGTSTSCTEFDENPKYERKKSTADESLFNSDETGYDILAWAHFYLPKIEPNFEIGIKLKRLCSHAMHPFLACYLLDHSRSETELFKSLEGKLKAEGGQRALRFFCDLKWKSCPAADRRKLVQMYKFSPRGLIENAHFQYPEFENRLLKIIAMTSARREKYGMIKTEKNIWLELWPFSFGPPDLGGAGQVEENFYRLPTESFVAFKHCGLAKTKNGAKMTTAAQLVTQLKNTLYRSDRNPSSHNLCLSKYTDWMKIDSCLGIWMNDNQLSQFSLIFILEFLGKSPKILSDISRLQALYKKCLILSYEVFQAVHIALELEDLPLNGMSAKEYLEKRYFEMACNNTNISLDFTKNDIENTVNLDETV